MVLVWECPIGELAVVILDCFGWEEVMGKDIRVMGFAHNWDCTLSGLSGRTFESMNKHFEMVNQNLNVFIGA